MKKHLRKLAFVSLFALAAPFVGNAAETETCVGFEIHCADGINSIYGEVCDTTVGGLIGQVLEIADDLC
ncbi:MAG: hypothetical protein RBR97_13965 [Bacteroidales bacterium]|jgi:hypothetical protein|nr:hypothetical protein [Bacteroidales bacterium]